MSRIVLLSVLLLIYTGHAYTQIPSISSGQIVRHKFSCTYLASRNIDIWLPPGYDASKKYPVIYMNDGQMLFDSSNTWNKKEWGVDEIAGDLIRRNIIRPFIAVGIWNAGPDRHREYLPRKPFNSLSDSERKKLLSSSRSDGSAVFNGDSILSDEYLRFLVEELMPFVQKNYSASRKRRNTFIMGSSMGGLISLYAVCEYPRIFGGAACLSTHWPGIFSTENNPFSESLFNYMKNKIPSPADHKFYFDRGTATLDSMYAPFQHAADNLFIKKGFDGKFYSSRIFEGAPHDENAWRERLDQPLLFLLGR